MRVSVWPDNFNPSKISSLVNISIMLDVIINFSIPLPSILVLFLVSKFKIFITSLLSSFIIYLSRPGIRPFPSLRL